MELTVDIKVWLDLIQWLVMLAVGIWAFFMNRTKANQDEQTEQGNRITALEAKCASMPGHSEIGEVYEQIGIVRSQLSEMKGYQEASNQTLNLIHEWLLQQK